MPTSLNGVRGQSRLPCNSPELTRRKGRYGGVFSLFPSTVCPRSANRNVGFCGRAEALSREDISLSTSFVWQLYRFPASARLGTSQPGLLRFQELGVPVLLRLSGPSDSQRPQQDLGVLPLQPEEAEGVADFRAVVLQ